MNLSGEQLKDTYGNLLTIGTSAGSPTTGSLQNGDGDLITQVGVNVTPSATLHVNKSTIGEYLRLGSGNIRQLQFSSFDTASAHAGHDIDASSSNGILTLSTGGTERLRIDNGGDISFRDTSANQAFYWDASTARLGLGTTTPTLRLDVRGTQGSPASSGTSQVGSLSIRGTGSHFISSGMLNVSPWTGWFQSQNANDLSINYPLALNPNGGHVGIGTDSPSTNLEIDGGTSTTVFINSSTHSAGTANEAKLQFGYGHSGSPDAIGYIKLNENSTNSFDGTMTFGVPYNNGSGGSATRDALVIKNDGNVGIGTSPSYPLQVDTGAGTFSVRAKGGSSVTIASDASLTYFGDTHEFSNSAGTTEFMRIDSSGNVGIGDTPKTQHSNVTDSLNVGSHLTFQRTKDTYIASNFYYNSSDAGKSIASGWTPIYQQDVVNGNHIWLNATASATGADETVSIQERMRIDSSGRIGVGVTPESWTTWTPIQIGQASTFAGRISVNQTDVANNWYYDGAEKRINAGYAQRYVQDSSGDHYWMTAGTSTADSTISFSTPMMIKNNGDLLIGTTANVSSSQGGAEFLAGESGGRSILRLSTTNTTANDLVVFFNGNGIVGRITTSGSATSYQTSSDYRLKENVVEMTGALDRVDQLKPSRFNFISDADTTVDGFLAHEVADVVPEAISGEKDAVDEEGNPIYQGIDQSKLVPLLVGAIKELRAEIEQLKNQ